jgi:predicted permease
MLWDRIVSHFRKRPLDAEFAAEMESHIEMLVDEYRQRGLSEQDARRVARIEVGNVTHLNEQHREVRGLPFMDMLLQDLRYGVRSLLRGRGFTFSAILIAGLGIAGAASVFSVVNAILLRPLPVKDPSALVWIRGGGDTSNMSGSTMPVYVYRDVVKQSQTLEAGAAYFAFYGQGDKKMTGDGEAERLSAVPISQTFLPVLGVQPAIGRNFSEEECQQERDVAILSARFWKRRFQSDPNVYGRKIVLNDRPVTVIGVLPESFDFASIFAPAIAIDVLTPLPITDNVNRMGNTVPIIGRLRPGATLAQLSAELKVVGPEIGKRWDREGMKLVAGPLSEHVSGKFRPALYVLSAAVLVLMLIVCANLSSLQLARAISRRREMAVRIALGAGKGRLIRQMLTENILLMSVAAAAGIILAYFATKGLAGLATIVIARREAITFDWQSLLFALGLAVVTGIIAGLFPAFQVPEQATHDSLKDSGRSSSEGRDKRWLRSALVVAEISFACVLLAGAGLLARSFLHILDVQLGFRPDQASSVRIDSSRRFADREQRRAYYAEALRLVREAPGIDAAALTDVLPLGWNRSWGIGAKEKEYSRTSPPEDGFVRVVSEGYVESMGLQIIEGRDFRESDNSTSKRVILLNQTLAKRLWPNRSAIGQMTKYGAGDSEVVGVVADVRHLALDKAAGNEFYVSFRQSGDFASANLVVRSKMPNASVIASIRQALQTLDPNLPMQEFRNLQTLVDNSLSPRRLTVYMLIGFSLFAVLLASLGIYAVVSNSVERRTQEIGVRMALGASASDVRSEVLLGTLKLAGVGIAIGVAGAALLSQGLSALLYGVTPADPVTFAATVAAITTVAALAGYIPALRASRVEPMEALRST